METAEKSVTERIVPMALLSTLATESGDAQEGEALARELLQVAEKYGSPTEVLAAKRALARALDVQGRYSEAVPLLETCHHVYEAMGLSCDAPNHMATLDRLIRMEVARGNPERAREWFEAVKQRLPEVDSPVGGAFQSMASAHLRQLEAPASAALSYWQSAEIWRKLKWPLLELKMLVDCQNAVALSAGKGEGHPQGVPEKERIESRVAELSAELKVPRPAPVAGAPLA